MSLALKTFASVSFPRLLGVILTLAACLGLSAQGPVSPPPGLTIQLVQPTNGSWFQTNTSVALRAQVRPGENVAEVHFAVNGTYFAVARNPLRTVDGALEFMHVWRTNVPGNYTLSAKVTNRFNVTATSSPVSVIVGQPVTPPPPGHFSMSFYVAPWAGKVGNVVTRDFSFAGPATDGALMPGTRVVADPSARFFYAAEWPQVLKIDAATGNAVEILEELSWPMGAAYDSKRGRLVIVTLGGDGHLYALQDGRTNWTVLKNLGGRDFESFVYHPTHDAFYGIEVFGTGSNLRLTKLTPNGDFVQTYQLPPLPQHIEYSQYRTELAAVGDGLAMIVEPKPHVHLDRAESRIYAIDPAIPSASLTYSKAWINWPPVTFRSAPQPRITHPTNGFTLQAGSNLEMMIQVPDADSDVRTVEVFNNDRSLGFAHRLLTILPTNGDVFGLVLSNLTAGSYSLKAKATDSMNLVGWSPSIGIQVLGPTNHVRFNVDTRFLVGGRIVEKTYTENGPADGGPLIPGLRMVGGNQRYLFGAEPHSITRYDSQTQQVQEITALPAGLPELSWPMGAAYDTLRNRIIVASLGGGGYLYQYYYASNTWTVLRSLDGRDLESIVYHRQTDAFYAAETSYLGGSATTHVDITRFNQIGEVVGTITLTNLPYSLWGADRSELLALDDKLLLFLEGDPGHSPLSSMTAYRESRIYLIDPRAETYELVWQKRWDQSSSIRITAPASGARFTNQHVINLFANVEAPFTNPDRVEFYSNGSKLGLGHEPPTIDPISGRIFRLSWTNAPSGSHRIVARVFQGNLVAESAPVEITVIRNPLNQPPLVHIEYPVPGQLVTNQVALIARAFDPDGTIASVEFFDDGRSIGFGVPDSLLALSQPAGHAYRLLWTNPPAGSRTVSARATDNRSATAWSGTVNFIVVRPPTNVTVRITSPQQGARFTNNQPITIRVLTRGAVERVELFSNGLWLGDAHPSPLAAIDTPWEFIWTRPMNGTNIIQASARYDGFRTNVSAPVTFYVVPPQPLIVATRLLPDSYRPGAPIPVQIRVQPSAAVTAYAVEDAPPGGWRVINASPDGLYDPANGKVKFGPYRDRQIRTLTYTVIAPTNAINSFTFEGRASANGQDVAIIGDQTIAPVEIRHPADSNPADYRITLNELTAYAGNWTQGTNSPLSYVTRAGLLWKGGEAYRFDPNIPSAPMWWVPIQTNPPFRAFSLSASAASRSLPTSAAAGSSLPVRLTVEPAPGTTVHAVEEQLPVGWTAASITHGGEYSAERNVIRWGPFYDSSPRELSYIANPTESAEAAVFIGKASFDGLTSLIAGQAQLDPFALRFSQGGDGVLTLSFDPPAGVSVTLESATSPTADDWQPIATSVDPVTGSSIGQVPASGSQRFYRLRAE
ncbi:MAG TPA: Ig-like domain-containing protein [Methylomirabilota bacterium]|nr:Ig-like domain-containing protein [Methylomirabilota bacterium]